MKKHFFHLITLLLISHSSFSQNGFTGTFKGVVNDVNAVLDISTTNNLLIGDYQEGEQKLSLQGQVLDNEASGEMLDPASGTPLSTFYFLLNGNSLNARFSVLGLVDVDAVFSRSSGKNNIQAQSNPTESNPNSATAAPPAKGNLDPALFGTWMHETITNSGSGSTYAGMTSVRYYTYNSDGTYREETASAGGGGDWSFSSGGRELQAQGWWKIQDGRIYVKSENESEFSPMLKHFFHDGNLVFKKSDGTYLIYHK
ncbi:MAG TPA: hypothetical protein PLU53_08875 [Bacteroidia bacterium]|nr:hypothetical protein [Bacteroidia bacterium]